LFCVNDNKIVICFYYLIRVRRELIFNFQFRFCYKTNYLGCS
jgi:hypothetical protein